MKNLCECFEQLITNGAVNFFTTEDGIFLMPYIPNSKLRFNNCPCCGSNVRDLKFTLPEYETLFDH